MANNDYFFLIFLGTIALTRLFVSRSMAGPTFKGFRVRHYMYGIVLIVFSFLTNNLTLYAISLGLIVDEIPPILVKGPGHKDEDWRGCEDYKSSWCVAGVFILTLIVFIFRSAIAGLI